MCGVAALRLAATTTASGLEGADVGIVDPMLDDSTAAAGVPGRVAAAARDG